MSTLYSDFKLTRDNCHREPIHRPEAIQGTGHLFAFQDDATSILLAMSENAAETLGLNSESLWAQGANALPPALKSALEHHQQSPIPVTVSSYELLDHATPVLAICHQHNGVIFLELETAESLDTDAFEKIAFADTIRKIKTVESLCEYGSYLMRQTFGFDRVMAYQFDPDGHGFVAGESKREDLEPFLGLHYPATDIPQPSRDLFLMTRSRSIPDIDLPNHSLLFREVAPGEESYLDLSHCQLRATSPIHLEYLRNMGVYATMTLAIVVRGKLWGLFVMHHYSARNLDYAARLKAELFALIFSHRLLEIENEIEAKIEKDSRGRESAFLRELRVEDRYQLRILREKAQLQTLCPCDGSAVIAASTPFTSVGLSPNDDTLKKLRDWLVTSGVESAYASDNISEILPDDLEGFGDIGGLLAIRVSEVTETFIVWFRRQQSQQIQWAGDPRGPQVELRADKDGREQLGPRQSFVKWLEDVHTRSLPWERWTLNMADRLREQILRRELKHTAVMTTRARREFMELTYAASHDLQEPLRSQANYLNILQEELEEQQANDDLQVYVVAAKRAVDRMHLLVKDMLEYSQLASNNTWVMVDVDALLQDLEADFADALGRSGGEITWDPMPTMVSDPRLLRSILQNLISNGIKYVEPDIKPSVHIGIKQDDQTFDIFVTDNGIGIEEQYSERIFSMFTRLHRKDEFSGTGIGLAIVKRAVEALGGSIGFKSSIGQGSTFWCRFHGAKLSNE